VRRVMGNFLNTHGYYTVYSTSTYTNQFCAICDCAISSTTDGTKSVSHDNLKWWPMRLYLDIHCRRLYITDTELRVGKSSLRVVVVRV